MSMQPSKEVVIPSGATHWAFAYVYPFFIVDGDNVSQYIDGEWQLHDRTIPVRKSVFHEQPKDPVLGILKDLIKLEAHAIPVGSFRFNTTHGAATQVGAYFFLDKNEFGFEPVNLYPRDILSKSIFVYGGEGKEICSVCKTHFDGIDITSNNGRCPSAGCPSNLVS